MKWHWVGYLPHPRDKDSDRKTWGSMLEAEPSSKVLWARAITSLPLIGWGHGCCHALVQVLIKVVSPLPANGMVVERLGTAPRLANSAAASQPRESRHHAIHSYFLNVTRPCCRHGLLCPFLSWMNDFRNADDHSVYWSVLLLGLDMTKRSAHEV